jgi:hypothetical protein
LVNPVLEQACGGNIARVVAKSVNSSHVKHQRLLVLTKLAQHVGWRHKFGVIVEKSLQTPDLPYRPDGCATDLSDPFGDVIGHREDLIAVIVEEEMKVTKMWSAHMPVEVLRLEIERKEIGKKSVERTSYVSNRLMLDI